MSLISNRVRLEIGHAFFAERLLAASQEWTSTRCKKDTSQDTIYRHSVSRLGAILINGVKVGEADVQQARVAPLDKSGKMKDHMPFVSG